MTPQLALIFAIAAVVIALIVCETVKAVHSGGQAFNDLAEEERKLRNSNHAIYDRLMTAEQVLEAHQKALDALVTPPPKEPG